ncbi:MAG TPA: phosphoglycolate phosphatase [Acetobacteraceae bacterium]|nr:phosphoglycolate phosphatase [Acetobacteraceae bacterium]
MTPTLILDLDGTLLDSLPDLAAALNGLLTARGLAPLTEPEVRAMIGDGVRALVQRGLAAREAALDPDAVSAFLAIYEPDVAARTRPYPGIEAALARLAAEGWRLAVCTNKPEAAARALLDALGLMPYFAAIGGGDTFPERKPHPGHVLGTLRAAGGDPARAIMVGDLPHDIAAARAAGLPCIYVTWGYGSAEAGQRADAVIDRAKDLPAAAARLLGRS